MIVSPKTIRFSFLFALLGAAGFFIYSSLANPFKLNAPPSSAPATNLNSGLVGYWTMDGQDTNWQTQIMTDKSGAGNNGTITNMSTSTSPVPGVAGQALKFDGNNDFISLGTPSSLDFTPRTNAFSITAWIKTNNISNNQQIVNQGNETATSYRLSINATTGFLSGAVGGTQSLGTTNLGDNKWHFVVMTVPAASTGLNLYVDAIQEKSDGGVGTGNSSAIVAIGARSDGLYFNGSIDEVRIYNRVLSASEVSELYNQGAKRLLKANVQDTNRLTSGLVGYWTMDGQDTNWRTQIMTDKSGVGNNGTITNMSTSTSPVPGVVGQALKFDGSNDNINMGNDSDFNFASTSPFTACAWIKTNVINYGHAIVSKILTSGLYNGWTLFFGTGANQGKLRFYIVNSDPAANQIGAITTNQVIASTQNWYHTCATYTGNKLVSGMGIYVNGNSQSLTTQSNALSGEVTSTAPFSIGSENNVNRIFNGSIDEVRVYNRALSASEITELYNAGAKKLIKINNPDTSRLTSGLVGYWTMDGQDTNWQTQTMTDKSGSSNNGTITNMSTSTSPVPGVAGQAFKFDGSNDYINLGTSAFNFTPQTDAFSIAAWVKTNNSSCQNIVAKGNDSTKSYTISTCGGTMYNVAGNTINSTATNIIDNQWHFVVSTVPSASSGLKFYVDGIEKISNGSIGTLTSALATTIGSRSDPASFFNGSIDEVRVYNRALSVSEVAELYRAGR